MKYLLIVFSLVATFALQPALAEESADAPAPTSQSAGTADTDNGGEKDEDKSGEKKPAAEEAEPECD